MNQTVTVYTRYKECPKNYTHQWTHTPLARLTLDLFPVQVAAFGILCLLSSIFYLRKDCNKNRRLRIFMSTIAAADTVLIHMFVLIYIGHGNMHKCSMDKNGQCFENLMLCYNRFYRNYTHVITFVANFSMAVSTWSITMMLFDHLVGIKNPFWKQSQERPVRTAYLTILLIVVMSFIVTVHFMFKITSTHFDLSQKTVWLLRVVSTVDVLYMFVVPTTAMFVYIYLISYHIHQSQKVFSNRNEVCHAATRSSSTDGLRVHRGRRFNDSQRKIKIIPRMLVFVALNYLLSSLPSVFLFLKTYLNNGAQIYIKSDSNEFFKYYFIVNFCLINGKIMFYLIIILSHASRFWKFLALLCCGFRPSTAPPTYGSLQSGEDRHKLSKTSTARSDASAPAEEHALVVRRTQSNIPRKPQRFSLQDQFELHQPSDTHSIHSFSIDKVAQVEKKKSFSVDELV